MTSKKQNAPVAKAARNDMARLKKHAKAKAPKTKETVLLKHRLLLKRLSENIRKGMTMQQAMLDVGYSDSYAKTSMLKYTNSWHKLLEETFPDKLISEKLTEHLKAKQVKQMYFHPKVKDNEIKKFIEDEGFRFVSVKRFMATAIVYFVAPDYFSQEKALEKLLKLKNKYGETVIRHKFGDLSDEAIEGEIAGTISEAIGLGEGEEQEAGE